jgi:hypothetical protein
MKKQNTPEEFHRMVKLAGINEIRVSRPNDILDLGKSHENEQKLIDELAKQVDGYDIYKDNHGLWEDILFYTYDEWLDTESDFPKLNVSITPEEWNTLHNEMSNNYAFNYFVRNFSVGDDEQTQHGNDIDKDTQYFKNIYGVDYNTARLMKKLIDDYLAL